MISIQGVFLTEWDGLTSQTSSGAPVLVLGATNRINDLDPAILRRMPVTIQTPVPDLIGREDILKRLLIKELLDPDLDISTIALRTEGYTGAELKELTRAAALNRVKAVVHTASAKIASMNDSANKNKTSSTKTSDNKANAAAMERTLTSGYMLQRPINANDFETALNIRKSSSKIHTFNF